MSRRPRRAKRTVMSVAQYRQTGSEHSLQVSVVEYLELHRRPRVYFFAIPNAAKRSWYLAARMQAEGLRAGVADLCIMLPDAQVRWLELKTKNEQQSSDQLFFEMICDELCHPYMVARTFDGAIEILRRWGALKEPT